MSGTTAMLKPKLRAILSIPSRSPVFGKRAAMSVYPGTKRSTITRPRGMRTGRSFRGVRVKTNVASARITAASRSGGIPSNFFSILTRRAQGRATAGSSPGTCSQSLSPARVLLPGWMTASVSMGERDDESHLSSNLFEGALPFKTMILISANRTSINTSDQTILLLAVSCLLGESLPPGNQLPVASS